MADIEMNNTVGIEGTQLSHKVHSSESRNASSCHGNAMAHSSTDARTPDDRRVAHRKQENSAEVVSAAYRLVELEVENIRLQQLVAELLVKNQRLRELLCGSATSSAASALPVISSIQSM